MYPLLLDRFLENAIELDVDALADGEDVYVAGIMQHVEEAGVHSGDSACVLPPLSLGDEMLDEIRRQTTRARAASSASSACSTCSSRSSTTTACYVIEANPRASRTVPFVSKAIGVPLAKVACRLILGERLADQELPASAAAGHVSVKEAVLPFQRLHGADALLGPEMKSTGEVMGIAEDFPTAFGKAQAAAGVALPREGTRLHHRLATRTSRRPPSSPRGCTTSASGCSPRAARRRRSARWGSRSSSSTRSARARRTSSTASAGATSTW